MIKDKVIKIKEDGEYNGRPKWKVQTQKNGEYTFFTNFTAKEGEIIEFTVNNEKYKTAKLLSVVSNVYKYDTAQSILRQVAFKGAIQLAEKDLLEVDDIEHYTNQFHKLLNAPVK